MERLAIMFCPYCGAPEPHEEEYTQDQHADSTIAWCMSCGEQCLISRSPDDDDNVEAEEAKS
jgi:hypothetical protein